MNRWIPTGMIVLAVVMGSMSRAAIAGEKEDQLMEAVRMGDAAKAAALLKDGAKPTDIRISESSPLELAVQLGDAAVVKVFIDGGANLAEPRQGLAGWLPLEWVLANEAASVETVRVLLAASPKVNEIDWKGLPPPFSKAAMNNPEIMSELLKAGADPKKKNKTWTVTDYVLIYGCAGSLNMILDAGGELADDRVNGRNVWHRFSGRTGTRGTREMATLLKTIDIKGINDPDENGWTPLQYAAWVGDAETIRVMVEAGADVNKAGDGGQTPLIQAILTAEVDAIRTLLELKADANAADDRGATPLYWALTAADPSARKRWNKAERPSWKAEIEREQGAENVYLAAERMKPLEVIKLLLDAGADPNEVSGGWSPLALAALMWDHGNTYGDRSAETRRARTVPNSHSTRFYANHDPVEVVKLLVDAGAVREISSELQDPITVAGRRLDARKAGLITELRKAKVRSGEDRMKIPRNKNMPRF